MTPELRPIAKLTLASTAALLLLATPVAIDWRTLDIDTMRAAAEGDNDNNGGGNGGGLGGALGNAAGAIGGAVGAVADGVSDAADGETGSNESSSGSGSGETSSDSGSGETSSDSGSGETSSGSGSGETSSGSESGETSSGSGSAEAGGDAAPADSAEGSAPAEAAGGAAPSDDASSDDSVADSGEAADTSEGDPVSDVADTAPDTAAPATDVADDVTDDVSVTEEPEVAVDAPVTPSTDESVAVPADTAGRRAVSQTRITVPVTTVRVRPRHRDGGEDDRHRLVGSSPAATTAIVDLPPDEAKAAAIAPKMRAASCTTDDGRPQGAHVSCLIAGSENEVGTRQIAYAPSGTPPDGGTPDPAAGSRAPATPVDTKLSPTIDKYPGGPSVYDELYGLQQVEARRYANGDVPVLIVQGIVSNMSNGQRSVPPLIAIVQDEQGKELLRWRFRAEAETLGPGGSTGFRSEMFDPQSESAKVTIVFAAEQQAMP